MGAFFLFIFSKQQNSFLDLFCFMCNILSVSFYRSFAKRQLDGYPGFIGADRFHDLCLWFIYSYAEICLQ